MPLFRPATDRIGWATARPDNTCPGCPPAWFHSGFAETDVQGIYVQELDGSFNHTMMPEEDVRLIYPNERIFVVGRDNYYVSLADARRALDVDDVRQIHYVDDYDDEYQDYYVCDPTSPPFNIPGAPANAGEPVR